MRDSQKPQFHAEPLLFIRRDAPGTLVDVGANVGYHLGLFMQVNGAHIVAYEPQRQLFVNLCGGLNDVYGGPVWPDNLEIHNVALSNYNGRTLIRVPIIDGHMDHTAGSIIKPFNVTQMTTGQQVRLLNYNVQVTTLDSQNLTNVTYLKINAEGAEQEILMGATQLLRMQHPVINIELEEVHRANCLVDIPLMLKEYGYRGFFVVENKLHDFSLFRREQHQVCDNSGIGATNYQEPYVFDFLFVHQDDSWTLAKLAEVYGTIIA